MSRIKTNFRGLRALVLHAEGAPSDRLAEILERLGLVVILRDPAAMEAQCPQDWDLVLFDADEEIDARLIDRLCKALPTIALIGNEAPSRLTRLVRFGCTSHILKPVRSTGVYTALVLAINAHEQERQTLREIATLRQRLAGRRIVMKAVLRHMALWGSDEDTAYEALRRRAMELRLPIEVAARMTLDTSDPDEPLPSRRQHRKA